MEFISGFTRALRGPVRSRHASAIPRMVAERGQGRITFPCLAILGHAAAAGAAAMEALAERVRLVEGEVTRRREVLADNENVRLRLDAAEQQ
eukprot:7293227-Pyramimonas_sp.AAC.1